MQGQGADHSNRDTP